MRLKKTCLILLIVFLFGLLACTGKAISKQDIAAKEKLIGKWSDGRYNLEFTEEHFSDFPVDPSNYLTPFLPDSETHEYEISNGVIRMQFRRVYSDKAGGYVNTFQTRVDSFEFIDDDTLKLESDLPIAGTYKRVENFIWK